jgi:hypothetical protein
MGQRDTLTWRTLRRALERDLGAPETALDVPHHRAAIEAAVTAVRAGLRCAALRCAASVCLRAVR